MTDQQHCAHGAASLIVSRRLAGDENAATSAKAASTRRAPARSAAPTTGSAASRARTASSVAATRRAAGAAIDSVSVAGAPFSTTAAKSLTASTANSASSSRGRVSSPPLGRSAPAPTRPAKPSSRLSADPQEQGASIEPREIAGAVAQQRRAAPPQGRNDDFADRAGRRRRAGRGIDDFDQQLVLAQMAAAMEGAIDRAAVARLGHAPVAEDFGAPGRRKRARQALGDVVGAQQDGARADRRAAVVGGDARRRQQRDRRPGDDVGPLFPQPGGERDRIERRRRGDGSGAETAQRDREPRGDAAGMAAGKGDRRPVARPREQSHAVMEEIDGRFQVVGGEMEPLRRTAGA